ncbi:murein transglycosylase A [Acuticoccus sp.]|uniref:murein transglycosylase A n=1 Tax=Acuticoccus sp. TaxID=1904378 RepID=UPI003B52F296
MAGSETPPYWAVPFSALAGWDDAEAAALLAGIAPHLAPDIAARPAQAPWLPSIAPAIAARAAAAADFVAAHFVPWRVGVRGFLTGYYEPSIPASRTPHGSFRHPIYRRPDDLVRVHPGRADLPGDGTFARRAVDGTTVPYHDRSAIVAGALEGRGLELAFVEDPVDAFFAQVQGSARLVFEDGSTARISYHGKTGHPYVAIGRVLIDRGWLPEGGATMQTIRAVLKAHPEIVDETLAANPSFVFFREREGVPDDRGAIAAGGVPLTPYRSLAVDRAHVRLGTPVYLETILPRRGEHHGVTIAEDTGSAIVGPARGDLFIGSGAEAGEIAGELKAPATFTLLLPRGVAP